MECSHGQQSSSGYNQWSRRFHSILGQIGRWYCVRCNQHSIVASPWRHSLLHDSVPLHWCFCLPNCTCHSILVWGNGSSRKKRIFISCLIDLANSNWIIFRWSSIHYSFAYAKTVPLMDQMDDGRKAIWHICWAKSPLKKLLYKQLKWLRLISSHSVHTLNHVIVREREGGRKKNQYGWMDGARTKQTTHRTILPFSWVLDTDITSHTWTNQLHTYSAYIAKRRLVQKKQNDTLKMSEINNFIFSLDALSTFDLRSFFAKNINNLALSSIYTGTIIV